MVSLDMTNFAISYVWLAISQNVPGTTTNQKRILLPVVPDVQIIHIQSVPQVTTYSSVHVALDMKDLMEAHAQVRILLYCLSI